MSESRIVAVGPRREGGRGFTVPFASAVPDPPAPGERCQVCHRRRNKERTSTSPEVKRVMASLPPDRAEALAEGLDNLQEYVGLDGASYPRGVLLEYLLVLGAQQREQLRTFVKGDE